MYSTQGLAITVASSGSGIGMVSFTAFFFLADLSGLGVFNLKAGRLTPIIFTTAALLCSALQRLMKRLTLSALIYPSNNSVCASFVVRHLDVNGFVLQWTDVNRISNDVHRRASLLVLRQWISNDVNDMRQWMCVTIGLTSMD